MHDLLTYGYSRSSIDDLERLSRSALILDIRYRPASRLPQWSRSRLAALLGERYLHVPELGNRNYKGEFGEGIQIADMERGLAILEEELQRGPVILLCVCASPDGCHRRTVAEAACARWPGLKVTHLGQAATV